jgi:hypothetical protein
MSLAHDFGMPPIGVARSCIGSGSLTATISLRAYYSYRFSCRVPDIRDIITFFLLGQTAMLIKFFITSTTFCSLLHFSLISEAGFATWSRFGSNCLHYTQFSSSQDPEVGLGEM